MNQIMYVVGVIAVAVFILGYIGLQLSAPVLAIVSNASAPAPDYPGHPGIFS